MNEPEEAVAARFRKEEMFIDQSWIKDWSQGTFELLDQERIKAIKESSEPIKRLMFAFPPFCMVKATVPLRIPQMGTIGVVVAYSEEGNGGIIVKQSPDAEFSAVCDPRALQVVGYYKGFTPPILAAFF